MSKPTSKPTPVIPISKPIILRASQFESNPICREIIALTIGTAAIRSPVSELDICFSATARAPNGKHISIIANARIPFQCVFSELEWPRWIAIGNNNKAAIMTRPKTTIAGEKS